MYTHSNNELKITCGMYDNVDDYDITDTYWGKMLSDQFFKYPGYMFLKHNKGELIFRNFELYWDKNKEDLFNTTYENCLDILSSNLKLTPSDEWDGDKDYKKSICKNDDLLYDMFFIHELYKESLTIFIKKVGHYVIHKEDNEEWFREISKLIKNAKREAKDEITYMKLKSKRMNR